MCMHVTNTQDSSYCEKKNTIDQVTTMLATTKNVLFPGHNNLLTSTDDSSLAGAPVIIKSVGSSVLVASRYDLERGHF